MGNMKTNYRMFFELQREPFSSDIELDNILLTPALKGIEERIHYGPEPTFVSPGAITIS